MKVVRWFDTNYWQLASWVFLVVAIFNFGNEQGAVLGLLALGSLAVHQILTALRSPAEITVSGYASAMARDRS